MSSQNNIIVKFKDQPELIVALDDNPTVRNWIDLFQSNYNKEFPIFRDQKKYNLSYLNVLVAEANEKLGWSFDREILEEEHTVILHKYVERDLALGFKNIPEELDNLYHELHCCLHMVERQGFKEIKRRTDLQVEWFNDDGFALDESFRQIIPIQFGDVRLQNPFVGHIPLQIYSQNDSHNIIQTCKFHDFVRPGFFINTQNYDGKLSLSDYIDWWKTNAPDFIELHGLEKILRYTGNPVIGHVTNLNDLETTIDSEGILELEYVFTK
jgi:hypothetical protein